MYVYIYIYIWDQCEERLSRRYRCQLSMGGAASCSPLLRWPPVCVCVCVCVCVTSKVQK